MMSLDYVFMCVLYNNNLPESIMVTVALRILPIVTRSGMTFEMMTSNVSLPSYSLSFNIVIVNEVSVIPARNVTLYLPGL